MTVRALAPSARPLARLAGVVLALSLPACGGTDRLPADGGALADASEGDGGSPDCARFSSPTALGRVDDSRLAELSGLAASRLHPGLFYAHNDSGDVPRVFVLDERASVVATIALEGAEHVDYEDIAVGPGPDGRPWVFVGDVGNNAARDGRGTPRTEVVVYRFPEPEVAPSGELALAPEATRLAYPAAPHDCEAIFVDPEGDLFLLSKVDSGAATLFRAPSPGSEPIELEAVGSVVLAPGSPSVTGADLSPSGTGLLVRVYGRLHLFVRAPGEPWADTLARGAVQVPVQREVQGEAVAWLADGRGYVTAPEGPSPSLARAEVVDPSCAY